MACQAGNVRCNSWPGHKKAACEIRLLVILKTRKTQQVVLGRVVPFGPNVGFATGRADHFNLRFGTIDPGIVILVSRADVSDNIRFCLYLSAIKLDMRDVFGS